MLSQDTACQRLTDKGYLLGLIDEETYKTHKKQEKEYKEFLKGIRNLKINDQKPTTGENLLKRTDLDPTEIRKKLKISNKNNKLFERALNEIRYSGYIKKQKREVESLKKNETTKIPTDINYSKVKGLSNEVIEKLNAHKPLTLGQASRLEGLTPAAINLIAITIKKDRLLEKA
tara:strand:- start:103 stop:624 length:522 start_codon:yes stop_codon:yes gene_type:complete